MKAIIMAGGEGTRLRPLTCDCPKPMMRVLDKPVMEYSISLLACHGVTEAAVTLGYLPHRITDHFSDEFMGVRLHYYTERTPMGTAGGVYNAREFLTETFCVLSGDGVTDADLSKALEYHRSKNSKATIVLKRVPDPMAYGLVITAPDGKITRFLEKPSWGEVVSDTVNTGIYILEPEILDMIKSIPCDFGRDIFPDLARRGILHGWVMDGYWCDIGDINAYMQVNRDALDGKIHLPGMETGLYIHPAAVVDKSAVIMSPAWIGPGAYVGKGAHVGEYTVLGSDCALADFSSAKRSVLWPGARLGEGAQARGTVLARDSVLDSCARAFEGSVLGAASHALPESEIAPGACIWPGKTVLESVRQDANLVWGSSSVNRSFRKGSLPVSSPNEALRFAQAYAACCRPREVLLARTSSAVAAAIWHGCACGLMAQGVYVLDAGVCTGPQLRYALSLLRTDGALLADSTGVTPFSENGCPISLADQRSICALVARQDFPQPFSAITHPMALSGRSEHAYIAMLAQTFTASPENIPPIAIHSTDPYLLSIAERAFDRAGIFARCELEEELMELSENEIGIWLENGGSDISISHKGGMLSDAEIQLLRAWTALELGEKKLLLPSWATRAIREVADKYGAETQALACTQPQYEASLKETSPLQLYLATDGIYFALAALSALAYKSQTIEKWLSQMPRIHRALRTVAIADSNRGSIMRAFTETEPSAEVENGITVMREKGIAWISPDDSRPECTIVSESRDAEFAEELCDFCENTLLRAMKNDPDSLHSK